MAETAENTMYTTHAFAHRLHVTPNQVKRWLAEGTIEPDGLQGTRALFSEKRARQLEADLERAKKTRTRFQLSFSDKDPQALQAAAKLNLKGHRKAKYVSEAILFYEKYREDERLQMELPSDGTKPGLQPESEKAEPQQPIPLQTPAAEKVCEETVPAKQPPAAKETTGVVRRKKIVVEEEPPRREKIPNRKDLLAILDSFG